MTKRKVRNDLSWVAACSIAKPGRALEVTRQVISSEKESFKDDFMMLAQPPRDGSEKWRPLYFFLWKYVTSEVDLLTLIYEKMKINPLAYVNAADESFLSHISHIYSMQCEQYFLCFDNCQSVPDKVLEFIVLISRILNCKVIMLHRIQETNSNHGRNKPHLEMPFLRDRSLQKFHSGKSGSKKHRTRAPDLG